MLTTSEAFEHTENSDKAQSKSDRFYFYFDLITYFWSQDAIVVSLQQVKPAERICAVTVNRQGKEEDLYLRVRSSPFIFGGRRLLLLFLQDITQQQQWAALEQVFFHPPPTKPWSALICFSNLTTWWIYDLMMLAVVCAVPVLGL